MALLVVDDEESNRDMLSRRLRRQGFEVLLAENGPQALACVRSQAIDLVLLDIRMPGMSGMEVLKTFREGHSSTELPVIMVTAEASSVSIVEALDLGANDYITKPVDLPVALARIRTHLSQKKLQEALRESEERYALAARGANDGLWDWNLKTGQIYFSNRWKEMLGFSDGEISAAPAEWFDRVHPDDQERLQVALAGHRRRQSPQFECEHRMRAKDGAYRWMLARGLAEWDGHGEATRMAGSQTDVTVAKVADPLTGLPNRLLFMDRLERLMERSKSSQDRRFAVLFLDVDRFKNVNDSLGHFIGDLLLQAIAERLRKGLRSADTVSRLQDECSLARLGGDEFAVLMDDVHELQEGVQVAERIAAELRAPFLLNGHEVFATVSIGIAMSTLGYDQPEDLLRDADTAMYCAKEAGRARFQIFDVGMRRRAVIRLQVETDLRRALQRDELRLHYQPIVDLRTGAVAAFEGLVRWQHPLRGMLAPADFIPIAEETRLIVPMGHWVLEQACRDAVLWSRKFPAHPPLTVHVNFSSVQLSEPGAIDEIERIVRHSGLENSGFRLNFEITESTIMANPGPVSALLSRLKDLDVGLDIDDFGTGYSSLSQLQHLPVQTLKIDRSFVARLDQDAESLEISRMIVALAHNLGLDVIAEGVETARQAAQLRTLGCGFAQGYYFGRPADPQTIWAMVSQPAAVPAELLGQVPPSGDSELARLEAPC